MQPHDDALDSRAKELLRSLQGDAQLEAWAKRMQAQADTYLKNRKPDPLDQFLYY